MKKKHKCSKGLINAALRKPAEYCLLYAGELNEWKIFHPASGKHDTISVQEATEFWAFAQVGSTLIGKMRGF